MSARFSAMADRTTDHRIGLAVKQRLHKRKWSQARLARTIGMTEFALGRRLRGQVPFRTPEIREVAEVLNTSVSELLGEADA